MNTVWLVTNIKDEVIFHGDTFIECFKHIIDSNDMKESDYEELFDRGIITIKISKVRRRPFKILREVVLTIHDEIKRKECEDNGSSENHSCNDLFKEW